jgi:predicted Zn-dependent protease
MRAVLISLALSLSLAGCALPSHRDVADPRAVAEPSAPRRAEIAPKPLDAPGAAELEEKLGKIALEPFHQTQPLFVDPELTRYVSDVAARLVARSDRPDLAIVVTLADTAEGNAWSIVGGHVLVARGALALAESESELAATLAHEIGHVAARHSAHTFTTVMTAFRDDEVAPFPKTLYELDAELQADRLATSYLRAAGYETRSLARVLVSLERKSRYGGGEADGAMPIRLAHLARHTARDEGGEIARDRYLDRIDGLPLGDKPHLPNGRTRRLRVRRASEGGRFDRVAPRTCGDVLTTSELAILNATQPDSKIEPGRRLKCAVVE